MSKASMYPVTEIISRIDIPLSYGATLSKIAESREYADGSIPASVLATAFRERPDLHVIGIIENGVFTKVLDRETFFATLGRPFGWDILSKEPVSDFAMPMRVFGLHDNIFTVASLLRDDLRKGKETHYGIVDEKGGFAGVFSLKALLLYLARLSSSDIEMAGTLQERLVNPRSVVERDGFRFMAYSRQSKGVGGDFYYHGEIGDRKHFFAIGDVAGKGASASIVTSLLWGMFRMYDFKRGLRGLVRGINNAIVQTFHMERHLTGVFMIWDFGTMKVAVADMGHGTCYMVRDGKIVKMAFPDTNFPLGVDIEMEPKVYSFGIRQGDLFCAFTDGLVEQRNPAGEELGIDMLAEHIAFENHDPEGIIETVSLLLDRYRAHIPQSDDATWMQVEVR